MIVKRVLLSPLILLVAVLGQLAVVNRLPLPGNGGVPDLVLLVVTALGVTAGPMAGLLAGFAGGLAIDVAPPGGHLAGEYALVYCLAGYACGRIRDLLQGGNSERPMTTSLLVMAAGAAAGEAGKAALGRMLSDPNMTSPAIRHVLPAAVIYDVLLCPFVLWLVTAAAGQPDPERAPQARFPASLRFAPAFRAASAGAAPRLRLAGSTAPPVPQPVRAEPRLRLAAGRSSLSSRTTGASSPPRPALAGGRAARVEFAGGPSALRPARAANFQGKTPGKGWLDPGRHADPGAPVPRQARSPGKGFVRSATPPGMTPWRRRAPGKGWIRQQKPASPVNWQGRSPGRGWIRPSRPSRPSRASRAMLPVLLTGATARPRPGWLRPARPPASPRLVSPGRGWLRPVKPAGASWRPRSPGRGWLRPARPPAAPRLASPGRGWLRASKPPKPNWYTRSPSTRWLRRGRRRRLLLGGRR